MRVTIILALAAASLLAPAAQAQQRYDDRNVEDVGDWRDDREVDDRGYDDRAVADMEAAQRRFDTAQARFDRERQLFEREQRVFEDARARVEMDRERLAYRGQTWRGPDGRVQCRRRDGTVGTIIGGVAGALLGRAIDGGRRSAVGTIIGGGAGAVAGRAIEQGTPAECR